ncbi:uncharacterized protein LOC114518022 [Dendronephthya gigantea]|uniref:uncharacterized protein LOC114518022 n=1 Tax=Dendronephthya gigantea TaxID=151771 RepID=UPI00106B02F9|nr:uncharacterized protein LOC114518022 [Dendronephthya gigantea]XP_028393705.1 uncharacterized protein LOC114518022 [Dendronephthya gigantea]XP_028393706.1 uncharacterized protein LOC114518022 [Dendronephthya gigantea]
MKMLYQAMKMLFVCVLCLPLLTKSQTFLPTIFWDLESPALHPAFWSKVVNVKLYQTLTFVCPNNDISIVPFRTSTDGRSYYNLFVRKIFPNETNLDYDTFCDPHPNKSHYVFSCNKTRNTHIDFRKLGTSKRLEINTRHANPAEPTFNRGMDYVFFSTSNGLQNSLKTNSTKCTMVFRIRVCKTNEPCALPRCSTFGREEVCMPSLSNEPRDLQVTNSTPSSLGISWQPALNTDSSVAHYAICYRSKASEPCRTKLVESDVKSVILENLKASTEYLVRVRAVTCKGPGNYSKEISYTTPDDPVTSEPKEVTPSNITTTSVKINWKTPDFIVGNVSYYSVCVRELGILGMACKITLVEPKTQSVVIYDLMANTSYGIRVRADNCRPGNYSRELAIITLEERPLEKSTTSSTMSMSSTTMITSTAATTTKTTVKPHTALRQNDSNCPTFHSLSVGIGIIIGVVVALVAVALSAVLLHCRAKQKMEIGPVVKNAYNNGYRSSVSGTNTIDPKKSDSTMELYSIKSS